MKEKAIQSGLQPRGGTPPGVVPLLSDEFGEDKVKTAIEGVKEFEVELPSWVFGTFGGGRFGEYMPPGAARNISEKLDDAALVNRLTGATPRIATHILWDLSKDSYTGDLETAKAVKAEANQKGLDLGAINPTCFLKGSHRGSLSSDDKSTRQRYIQQTILGGQIAKELGNKTLALWFPDGSLYPGQIELRTAYHNIKTALKEAYQHIPKDITILIEYKLFEPGTYSTTIPDWGTAFALAKNMGPNVGVLIDLGHHPLGTNIEQIVALLIEENIPGGFHFNTRYAADDDQSVEPNPEIARIFYELVAGKVILNPVLEKNWAYMIDQASGRENRIQAVLHSIDSLQISLAKALLANRTLGSAEGQTLMREYQAKDEITLANRVFNNAIMNADVRPIVAQARIEQGLPLDPVDEYCNSGYQKKIEKARI